MDTTQGRTRRAVLATVGAAAVSGVAWASDSTSDTLRVTQDGAALVDDVTEIDADTFEERLLDDGTATFRPIDPDAETFAEFPADLGTTDFDANAGDIPEFVGQVTLGGRPLSNVIVDVEDVSVDNITISDNDLDEDEFDAAITGPLGRVVFPDQFGIDPTQLEGDGELESIEFATSLTDDLAGPTRLVAQGDVFDADDTDDTETPARFPVDGDAGAEVITQLIAFDEDGDELERIDNEDGDLDLVSVDDGVFTLNDAFDESDKLPDDTARIDLIYESTQVVEDAGFLGLENVSLSTAAFDFDNDEPAFEAVFVQDGFLAPGETVSFGHVAVDENELKRAGDGDDINRELKLDIDVGDDFDYTASGDGDSGETNVFPEDEVGDIRPRNGDAETLLAVDDLQIDPEDEATASDISISVDTVNQDEVRFKELEIRDGDEDRAGFDTVRKDAGPGNGVDAEFKLVFEAVDGDIDGTALSEVDAATDDDGEVNIDDGEYPEDFPENYKLVDPGNLEPDPDGDDVEVDLFVETDESKDEVTFRIEVDVTEEDETFDSLKIADNVDDSIIDDLDIDIQAEDDDDEGNAEIKAIEGSGGGFFNLSSESTLEFTDEVDAHVDFGAESTEVFIDFDEGKTNEVAIPPEALIDQIDAELQDGEGNDVDADIDFDLDFDDDGIRGLTRGVPLGEIDLAERAAEIGLENVETTIEVTSPATELDDATGRIDPDTIVRLFLAFETEDIRKHGLAVRNRRLRFPADANDPDQTVVQPAAARSADDIISLRSNRARLRPGRQPLTMTDASDDLPTVYVLADLLPPDTSGELASDAINALDGLRMRVKVASRLTGGS